MAKYSVNIEDDEVVSIEVDGELYSSPDEIPDPKDREKVEAIIAKMQGDDFDADFDRDFHQQFEELQRDSSKTSTIIISIFLGVAGIMLLIAVWSAINTVRSLARELETPGMVIDLIERRSVDSETGEVNWYSYPVVEFMSANGLNRVELNEGSYPPSYRSGEEVTILYDPDRPERARIKSLASSILQWILPGITGTVGLVFLVVTLFAFRVTRPRDTL
jgi:hypothetical protein